MRLDLCGNRIRALIASSVGRCRAGIDTRGGTSCALVYGTRIDCCRTVLDVCGKTSRVPVASTSAVGRYRVRIDAFARMGCLSTCVAGVSCGCVGFDVCGSASRVLVVSVSAGCRCVRFVACARMGCLPTCVAGVSCGWAGFDACGRMRRALVETACGAIGCELEVYGGAVNYILAEGGRGCCRPMSRLRGGALPVSNGVGRGCGVVTGCRGSAEHRTVGRGGCAAQGGGRGVGRPRTTVDDGAIPSCRVGGRRRDMCGCAGQVRCAWR